MWQPVRFSPYSKRICPLKYGMAESKIEWTEQTWNPATGCTKVSPGCKHCYAETMAVRLKAMGAGGYSAGFELAIHPERLAQPVKRKKPTVWFVNSMSDLFHEDISDGFLDQVFETIRATPQHTYQILTKRAKRLPTYFAGQSARAMSGSGYRLRIGATVFPVLIACAK